MREEEGSVRCSCQMSVTNKEKNKSTAHQKRKFVGRKLIGAVRACAGNKTTRRHSFLVRVVSHHSSILSFKTQKN